jgi:hypothetical protein
MSQFVCEEKENKLDCSTNSNITKNIDRSFDWQTGLTEAKRQGSEDNKKKVAALKEKWAKEKAQKDKLRNKDKAKKIRPKPSSATKIKTISAIKKFSNNPTNDSDSFFRSNLFDSLKERAEQKVIQEQKEKERRRLSVALNAEILQKARSKEVEMTEKKKIEEADLYESRRLDYAYIKQAKEKEKRKRRDSLIARGLAFKKEKKIIEDFLQQKLENEKKIVFDYRYESWKSSQEAKEKAAKKIRESLSGRLKYWRELKEKEKQIKVKEDEIAHEDFVQSHADWNDVRAYNDEKKKKERESLASRLQNWRRIREEEKIVHEDKERNEMNDRELRLQAHQDVMKSIENEKELRRKSLSNRLKEEKRKRKIEMKIQQDQMQKLHDELESRRQDWIDINAAKENDRQRARQSIAFRLDYWRNRKLADEMQKTKEMIMREDEHAIREMDYKSMEEARMKELEQEREQARIPNVKV